MLPFLFYLNSSLAFVVLACSALIVLVVLAYLRPLQRVFTKVIVAEAEKAAALGETIFGIKTVKSLAIEREVLCEHPPVEDRHVVRLGQIGRFRLARRRIEGVGARFARRRRQIVQLGSHEGKRFYSCFLQTHVSCRALALSPD